MSYAANNSIDIKGITYYFTWVDNSNVWRADGPAWSSSLVYTQAVNLVNAKLIGGTTISGTYYVAGYKPSDNTVLITNSPSNTKNTGYIAASDMPGAAFTIYYNASGGAGAIGSHVVYYGDLVKIADNTFTKKGYSFTGWTTNSDGIADGHGWSTAQGLGWSGTWEYTNGQYGIEDNTLTLYAMWAPNQYEIQYRMNSAEATGSTTNLTVTYGGSYTISASGYTQTGFKFIGWNTKADGTGDWYYQGDTGTYLLTNNLELFAQWQLDTFTVTLTYGKDNEYSEAQSITNGQNFVLPLADDLKNTADCTVNYESTITFDPDGGTVTPTTMVIPGIITYTLSKWRDTATGTEYDPGTAVTITSAISFEAVYKTDIWQEEFILPTPVRTGYTCTEWYCESFEYSIGEPGELFVGAISDCAVKAVWAINTYTITYNSGLPNVSIPPEVSKEYGSVISLNSPETFGTSSEITVQIHNNVNGSFQWFSVFQLVQYTFSHWEDHSGAVYAAGADYTVSADVVFTGVWSETTLPADFVLPTPPPMAGYTFLHYVDVFGNTFGIGQSAEVTAENCTFTALYAPYIKNVRVQHIVVDSSPALELMYDGPETVEVDIAFSDSIRHDTIQNWEYYGTLSSYRTEITDKPFDNSYCHFRLYGPDSTNYKHCCISWLKQQ